MLFTIPDNMTSAEVDTLIALVNKLTGAEVRKKTITMLETSDEKTQKILKILTGSAETNALQKSGSWDVISSNHKVLEQLKIEEKNERLADGKFEENQLLRYNRNGKYYIVKGKGGIGKPQSLVASVIRTQK